MGKCGTSRRAWRMRLVALVGICVGPLLGNRLLVDAREIDVLKVFNPATQQTDLVRTSAALFGSALPRTSSVADQGQMQLVHAKVDAYCHVVLDLPLDRLNPTHPPAFLVERTGECSFVPTVLAAQEAGAQLVIVRDTLQGALHAAQATEGNPPVYDCSLGNGFVSDNSSFPLVRNPLETMDCTSSSTCVSNCCVLTGRPSWLLPQQFEVCCVKNVLVQMQVDQKHRDLAPKIHIPAVFVTLHDGNFLANLVAQSRSQVRAGVNAIEASLDPDSTVFVQASNAEENPWNISMLLTWALGLLAVMGAAYYAARDERYFSYEQVASSYCGSQEERQESAGTRSGYISIGSDVESEGDDDRITLSTKHACYFLVAASSSLLLIYYVHLTSLLNIFFVVGSCLAFAQVVSIPFCSWILPYRYAFGWLHTGLSFALAMAVAGFWYQQRFSDSIWPLQDLLCICLCFVFIDTVQIPSFRVACYLLMVAFLYDVFFVFFSPLVFGSNVMVAVASGGAKVRACDTLNCDHERLPMVLSVPLFFTNDAGDALLGLGDLVVPGLLVSFCIRYDYCMGLPLSRHYYCVASCSYGIGLLFANVMAIVLRDFVAGQPALMYIVPIMLGSVALFAKTREELPTLWEGPTFMMDLPIVHQAVTNNPVVPPAQHQTEKQPFLRRDQV